MEWKKGTPLTSDVVIVSIKDETGDNTNYYTSTGWYYNGMWVVDNEVNMQVNTWMELPKLLIA